MKDKQQPPVDNFLVWGSIESKVARCFVYMPDGTKVPDEETRETMRLAFISFIRFFSNNKLLKIPAFDEGGKLIDREYRKEDVHEEVLQMIRKGAEKWLDSKSALKEPPDYKKLENILSDVRAGK